MTRGGLYQTTINRSSDVRFVRVGKYDIITVQFVTYTERPSVRSLLPLIWQARRIAQAVYA